MKQFSKILLALALIAGSVLALPVRTFSQDASSNQASASSRLTPAEAEKVIATRARAAVLALRNRDMAKLAAMTHPQKGLRFSPYITVNDSDFKDRVLTRSQLRSLYRSNRKYMWGYADGSGDPIRLTFRAYLKSYVYAYDFLSKSKYVSYNQKAQHGNSINTAFDFYPRAILVEYHVPGMDPRYDGMDWQSLWLAFEKQGGTWYLVGILHDSWTI